ncbi:MAG: hypothetical protein RIS92_536 [Verrucomicrobiota bacterium]
MDPGVEGCGEESEPRAFTLSGENDVGCGFSLGECVDEGEDFLDFEADGMSSEDEGLAVDPLAVGAVGLDAEQFVSGE